VVVIRKRREKRNGRGRGDEKREKEVNFLLCCEKERMGEKRRGEEKREKRKIGQLLVGIVYCRVVRRRGWEGRGERREK
jgi:hypothetical protein